MRQYQLNIAPTTWSQVSKSETLTRKVVCAIPAQILFQASSVHRDELCEDNCATQSSQNSLFENVVNQQTWIMFEQNIKILAIWNYRTNRPVAPSTTLRDVLCKVKTNCDTMNKNGCSLNKWDNLLLFYDF